VFECVYRQDQQRLVDSDKQSGRLSNRIDLPEPGGDPVPTGGIRDAKPLTWAADEIAASCSPENDGGIISSGPPRGQHACRQRRREQCCRGHALHFQTWRSARNHLLRDPLQPLRPSISSDHVIFVRRHRSVTSFRVGISERSSVTSSLVQSVFRVGVTRAGCMERRLRGASNSWHVGCSPGRQPREAI